MPYRPLRTADTSKAALRRGDSVAATARDVAALQDLRDERPGLLALSLDVTDVDAVRAGRRRCRYAIVGNLARAARQWGQCGHALNVRLGPSATVCGGLAWVHGGIRD